MIKKKDKVDEKHIQEVVARGLPKISNYIPSVPSNMQSFHEHEDIPESRNAQKAESKKRVTKEEQEEYEETYFSRFDFTDRQMLYVSKATHRKLTKIVQGIDKNTKANISSYVENIITKHFEEHKELINKAYRNNFEVPL